MNLKKWSEYLLSKGFRTKIFDPRRGKSSYFVKDGFCVRVSNHIPNFSKEADFYIFINRGKGRDKEYKQELLEKMNLHVG